MNKMSEEFAGKQYNGKGPPEKYLTKEIAEEFYRRAQQFPHTGCIGEFRQLVYELSRGYGILEVEAINILRGYHIMDYVDKYFRMQQKVPLLKKTMKEEIK